MASYSIIIKKSAEKEFHPIPKKDRMRLIMKIRQLAMNPRPSGSEKLSGQHDWRVRQGDYRIIYSIDENKKTITIQKVGHRREVYR